MTKGTRKAACDGVRLAGLDELIELCMLDLSLLVTPDLSGILL